MKFSTLMYRYEDAVLLGSAEKATMLEFVRWSVHFKETDSRYEKEKSKYHIEGRWWMQDSYETWQERMPWLSLRTIKRYIKELVDAGALIKLKIRSSKCGSESNYYRPCEEEQSAKLALYPRVPNWHNQSAKLALSSFSTNNQAKNHKTEPQRNRVIKLSTWEDSDPFAHVFVNLTALETCKAKFTTEDYRQWLIELQKEFGLTIKELEQTSKSWEVWHNDSTKKPSSIKGSYRTWITNYARKDKNGHSKRLSEKTRPEVNWDLEDDSRPF